MGLVQTDGGSTSPRREGYAEGGGCDYSITVPFEKNPLHLCSSGDDLVYLYAWCEALDEGLLSVPAYRRSRSVTMELPERWAGCEVQLYGFVADYAGRASLSSYIGHGSMPYREVVRAEEEEKTSDSRQAEPEAMKKKYNSVQQKELLSTADEGVLVVVGGVEGLLDSLGRSPAD